MNRYEQYLHTQRKDTPTRGFKVGDRIVWRYHDSTREWFGTIAQIDECGIICHGAWDVRHAFTQPPSILGTGRFTSDRTDAYLEHYIGEYNEQV